MKKNQKILKINDNNAISLLTLEGGIFELAHLKNGEVSYDIISDVITVTDDFYLVDEVQDLASRIVENELESIGYDTTLEADAQIIIETFTYNIWIAVCYYKNKISYDVCTTRDDDNFEDRNKQNRKTWKGLLNIIKHFDV